MTIPEWLLLAAVDRIALELTFANYHYRPGAEVQAESLDRLLLGQSGQSTPGTLFPKQNKGAAF